MGQRMVLPDLLLAFTMWRIIAIGFCVGCLIAFDFEAPDVSHRQTC